MSEIRIPLTRPWLSLGRVEREVHGLSAAYGLDVDPQARLLLPRLARVRELTERLELVHLQPGLLAQLAERRDVKRLAGLDTARDCVPEPTALG